MNSRLKALLKIVVLLVCCYLLGMLIGSIYNEYKKKSYIPEEFSIHQSFIMGTDDYKDTRLKVIVKVQDYDLDDMYNKIIAHHKKLNGMSNELHIELFNSMDDFINYNVADVRNYKMLVETEEYDRIITLE